MNDTDILDNLKKENSDLIKENNRLKKMIVALEEQNDELNSIIEKIVEEL